jgi:hypothetical protein
MPSNALLHWQTDRIPRLNEVDAQCNASLTLVPANPLLADENLRGYLMLLSAHFQGFCRDLHSECIQIAAIALIPSMQAMFQSQCQAGRQLDGANPKYSTLRKDFERFGLDLASTLAANPANSPRITHIDHLNLWRNYAAHHLTSMPVQGGPFTVVTIQIWKNDCDGLATELDGIMYNQLQVLIGVAPW